MWVHVFVGVMVMLLSIAVTYTLQHSIDPGGHLYTTNYQLIVDNYCEHSNGHKVNDDNCRQV